MSISFRIQLVVMAAVALPTGANACSCYVRPLPERYESASVVLVARIGELHDSYDASGERIRVWSFEVIEVLKGDVGFSKLVASSCGGHVLEGEEYLIFTGNDGEVDSCRSGNLNRNERYRTDLEVLRQRQGGGLQTLVEPWVFAKSDGMCSLSLDISSGSSLRFDYRFADAVRRSSADQQFRYDFDVEIAVKLEDVGPHPANFAGFSRLRVWYPHSHYKVEGSGILTIGGKEWTTRHETMEARYSSPFEVVADSVFSEVLSAVESHSSAWPSAEYEDFPYNHKDYPDFPEIKAGMPHYYRGSAVQSFQECIDRAGQ
jgi:hypothetical protein